MEIAHPPSFAVIYNSRCRYIAREKSIRNLHGTDTNLARNKQLSRIHGAKQGINQYEAGLKLNTHVFFFLALRPLWLCVFSVASART